MDPLQRQRGTNVVIYVLAQIQLVRLGRIDFFKSGPDLKVQIVQASVAGYGHTAFYAALHFDRRAVVGHFRLHRYICIQNVRIVELFKERFVRSPVESSSPGSRTIQFNYKGLQR